MPKNKTKGAFGSPLQTPADFLRRAEQLRQRCAIARLPQNRENQPSPARLRAQGLV